jgi:hypothetical protein
MRSMAGRGRGWAADVAHRCRERLHRTFYIPQHVVVPEAQHAIAARLKIGGSRRVARQTRSFVVLTAVEFDDETRCVTGEIREVRADRCLTAEVGA